MRRFFATTALTAALAAASAVAAQPTSELLGRYGMDVTYEGTGCSEDSSIPFEVTAIRGGTIEYKINEDTDTADYHGPSMSFRKPIEAAGESFGVMTGRFTRRPDSIRLDMEWAHDGCTARMAGIRPAPLLPNAPAAPPEISAGASVTPAQPGVPTAAPAAAASTNGLFSNPLVYIPIGVLLIGAGGLAGYLVARKKKPDA